jgi:hypothetical protein
VDELGAAHKPVVSAIPRIARALKRGFKILLEVFMELEVRVHRVFTMHTGLTSNSAEVVGYYRI